MLILSDGSELPEEMESSPSCLRPLPPTLPTLCAVFAGILPAFAPLSAGFLCADTHDIFTRFVVEVLLFTLFNDVAPVYGIKSWPLDHFLFDSIYPFIFQHFDFLHFSSISQTSSFFSHTECCLGWLRDQAEALKELCPVLKSVCACICGGGGSGHA